MSKKKPEHNIFAGLPLDKVKVDIDNEQVSEGYPFSLNIIKHLQEIVFSSQVTFFVGENGTGKSTILEAIAVNAGFGIEGGSKNINFKTSHEDTYSGIEALAKRIRLSWRKKLQMDIFLGLKVFLLLPIILIR